MNNYEDEGEVLIIGDFQSFPSLTYDNHPRNKPKRNEYSNILSDFLIFNEMQLFDVENGRGPLTTYKHKTLPNSSYIDHIAFNKHSSITPTNCIVHPFSLYNTGDHTPISITIPLFNGAQDNLKNDIKAITNDNHIPNYAWKDTSFIKLYNELLDKSFTNDPQPSIKDASNNIIRCATDAFNIIFDQRTTTYNKPWWTSELSKSKAILTYHFNQWECNDFKKDETCIIYNRYILARKNFRKSVKNAQNKKLYKQYITIQNLKNTDPQKFWKNIKTLKKDTSSRLYCINKKQNKKEITKEFANHFEHILNTPRIKTSRNNGRSIPPPNHQSDITITTTDLLSAIKKLKSNKSPDSFFITTEHLLCSTSHTLVSYLTKFYNQIFKTGEIQPLLQLQL